MEKIYITQNDYAKLKKLINEKTPQDEYDRILLVELEKAKIVAAEKIPSDVITINSQVEFIDLNSNNKLTYFIVFPAEADIKQNKISILSPIGCALLGYKIGDTIELTTPGGQKKLKVEKILHQPEAEGNFA